ncbi:MAG: hypothetical protein A2496_09630 [Burkholderiales bacterium RIFOXYC12_FULL_60_6]|nr:MAG: hypothetical protein A2496_09630 [Burkholderiales bacterium RIFOXYC12_FULL_60_6]
MRHRKIQSPREAWGSFRLSVIGQLLASPPLWGELQGKLEALAQKKWKHPLTGEPTQFVFSTIEEWYYQAKSAGHDPVSALAWKLRDDLGQFRALTDPVKQAIAELHQAHPRWTHQLHYDNLLIVAGKSSLGKVPSYATVRRYRQARGFLRVRTPRHRERFGETEAHERFDSREQRSFESTHVLGLLHSDFHHCSRKLLNEHGQWAKPVLVAIMDDRSRLVCHAQWYWRETAENFVHALCQAFLKRGLPRVLMTDNGSPMTAAETTQGLGRLGVVHQTTLPYTPQQNGKQESFWGQIEGRLMPMLEGEETLTLKLLNEATLAFIELDYHRKAHSETGETPIDRFLAGPEVARGAPSPEDLRMAFTVETDRSLRRSDCSISLESHRYEIPSSFRHLKRVPIRYAGWDLANVFLLSRKSGEIISRIFPRDLEKNADGRRRSMEPQDKTTQTQLPPAGIAPLLKHFLSEYAATGLPMNYIPKTEKDE